MCPVKDATNLVIRGRNVGLQPGGYCRVLTMSAASTGVSLMSGTRSFAATRHAFKI